MNFTKDIKNKIMSAIVFSSMITTLGLMHHNTALALDIDSKCQYESKHGVVNRAKSEACIDAHHRAKRREAHEPICEYENKVGMLNNAKRDACLKSHHKLIMK